jgi:hypothetical protein
MGFTCSGHGFPCDCGDLAVRLLWTDTVISVSNWYGIFCVVSVMQYHFSDITKDWLSTPQKHRALACWLRRIGRSAQEPVLLYEVVAPVVVVVLAFRSPFFAPAIGGSLGATRVPAGTRLNRGIGYLRRRRWLR